MKEQAAKDAILQAEKDKQAEEERLKQEALKAEQKAKRDTAIAYKNSIKALTTLCQENLQGSRYDKFWVESISEKLRTKEKAEEVIAILQKIIDEGGNDTE